MKGLRKERRDLLQTGRMSASRRGPPQQVCGAWPPKRLEVCGDPPDADDRVMGRE